MSTAAQRSSGQARKRRRTRPTIGLQFVVDGERTPGIELVERLLTTGEHHADELTPEVASQAIEALEHLELPWLVGEMIESGERFAEQVHNEAKRGLQEIVQNADDQGAINIRFGFRHRQQAAELLVAHDGNPVEIGDVVRMAWPLLSGSREDPDKIGRFGIGLKTLNQLGERLAVHCPPLPGFEIRGGRIQRVKTAPALRGFWDPAARQTLFVLRLQDARFDLKFFKDWLNGWDASSLLFLRHLQRVTLEDLGRRQVVGERAIKVGKSQRTTLELPTTVEAEQVTIREVGRSRAWTRYRVRYPRPSRLKATHKNIGDTVLLQIAVPHQQEENRLYVGLPLEEPCDLPFSLSAPFEPNVDRTHLRDNNPLNEWLIARLGDVAAAICIQRFHEQPKTGWRALALEDEAAGESEWVAERFQEMVGRQRQRVERKVSLALPDGETVRLDELVYEGTPMEGLLSTADIERIWNEANPSFDSKRAVPLAWRDSGRWRSVLRDIDGTASLTAADALDILNWHDDEIAPRGAKWLVDLAGAALNAGAEHQLWTRRCITLAAEGGRLSPNELATSGALLVHDLPKEGLAASLNLAQQIARPFRARNDTAETVRDWLKRRQVLREKATDADALRALAAARRTEPIDLSSRDPVLVRIRNSFEQLPANDHTLGPGIGRNIAIAGYVFQDEAKQPRSVRPIEAYLPSAIDTNEWPTAAAQTPGLAWIDPRYRETLKGPRGQGALAFLRSLGAATNPRLVKGLFPSSNPHATRLVHRALPAHQQEELESYPLATGLMNDWISRDLDAVLANLARERTLTPRRKRARALFLTLDRAWLQHYAPLATAQPVRHYHRWEYFGEVSATWVARLASEPWLSTQASGLHPAAPRDLTVLTEAAFEVEGEHPEKYAAEIDAEHVDSPVVEALGIQGRPFASSIVERLEDMRAAELAGAEIGQTWANRCYQALASYAPGGSYAERSNLGPRQLQHRFNDRKGNSGLIRANDEWLPPSKVRRDPYLDESLPRVTGNAETLWDLLGITPPTIADCETVMHVLAERADDNPSSEIRVLRHLMTLLTGRPRQATQLKSMPLRTHRGWYRRGKEPCFAVANPLLAKVLGQHWTVWRPPLPLDELSMLIPLLDVHKLDSTDFQPEIATYAVANPSELEAEFGAAVGQLRNYLVIHHPALHDQLDAKRWDDLQRATVIVGGGWGIRVRGPRKRSIKLTPSAHLFTDPVRFCVLHEDEVAEPDAGGQAIAGYFLEDSNAPEHRSTLALAWAYAYQRRHEERQDIDIAPEEAEDAADPTTFHAFENKGHRKRPKRRLSKRSTPAQQQEQPRELPDRSEVDLSAIKGTMLNARRRGTLRVSRKTELREPKNQGTRKRSTGTVRAGERRYTDTDREELAYLIIEAILGDTHGLNLNDTRSENQVGADAVDADKDIWIELKAHGREAPDTLRLEPAEARRAEEKKGKYWLVIVWNLEKPRTPEFVIVPDPLHRLDTYVGRGLQLTGVRALADFTEEKLDIAQV